MNRNLKQVFRPTYTKEGIYVKSRIFSVDKGPGLVATSETEPIKKGDFYFVPKRKEIRMK